MSTSRSTDKGDYVLIEVGEPTVEDPTLWYSADTQWKPGTPEANRADLRSKAATALAVNATFLAIASPSNLQVANQVKALTRQTNALIRLLTEALDSVANT